MAAERRRLPDRRGCVGFPVEVGGLAYHATVGFYEDGSPAEIFLDAGKPGSAASAAARDAAVLASLALQHGAPAETLRASLTGDRRVRKPRPSGRGGCQNRADTSEGGA